MEDELEDESQLSEGIELEYELSIDELLAYNEHLIKTAPGIRKEWKKHKQKSFGLCFVMVVIGLLPGLSETRVVVLTAAATVLTFLIFFAEKTWTERALRSYRKIYKATDNLADQLKYRLTIRPEGLLCSGQKSETRVSWDGVDAVRLTRDFIFLHTNDLSALPIPRRAFNSDTEYFDLNDRIMELKAKAVNQGVSAKLPQVPMIEN